MRTHTQTHADMHGHRHMQTCMYVCMYVRMYVQYVCLYVRMYICMYVYSCMCVYVFYLIIAWFLYWFAYLYLYILLTHTCICYVYIYIYIFSYVEADTFSIVVLKAQCSQFHSKPKHLRFQEVVRSRAQAQTCHGIATASSTAVPRHHSKPSVSAGESNQSLVRRCELGIQEAGQPGHC